jgi:DnaJ-class molecular chaperone
VKGQRPDQEKRSACRACRGRGWKHVGSRSPLAFSVVDDRARVTSKRRCLDCDGTGKE